MCQSPMVEVVVALMAPSKVTAQPTDSAYCDHVHDACAHDLRPLSHDFRGHGACYHLAVSNFLTSSHFQHDSEEV